MKQRCRSTQGRHFLHLSLLSLATLHVRVVPAEVTPVAPCDEQKDPPCTVPCDWAFVALCVGAAFFVVALWVGVVFLTVALGTAAALLDVTLWVGATRVAVVLRVGVAFLAVALVVGATALRAGAGAVGLGVEAAIVPTVLGGRVADGVDALDGVGVLLGVGLFAGVGGGVLALMLGA